MNFRMVAWWLCGAMVVGGCECGKGVTTEQDPPDASVEDAGLMLDAGQLVAQCVLSTANGDLILVRLDGGWSPFVERSSLGDAGHLRNARWQPNGTAVAFADGERAWKMFAGLTMVVELDAGFLLREWEEHRAGPPAMALLERVERGLERCGGAGH